MSDFTPGPWIIYGGTDYGHRVVTENGDAELGNWTMAERIRRVEDARLIATAPEMYEALKMYLVTYANTQSHPTPLQEARVIMAARDAITKAVKVD